MDAPKMIARESFIKNKLPDWAKWAMSSKRKRTDREGIIQL
jgi:hypothetical protein